MSLGVYRFANGVEVCSDSGHPQGVLAKPVGSIYLRTDGRQYVKRGGSNTAYGWYPAILDPADYSVHTIVANNSNGASTTGSLYCGTLVLNGTMTGAPTVIGNAVTLVTAAVNGSAAQIRENGTGPASMQIGQEFDFVAHVATAASIAVMRIWIGLFNLNGVGNVDNQAGDNYSFRFSTPAGDTGWRGVVDDQAGAGQSLTANMGTVAANTRYRLRIRGNRDNGGGNNGTIYFSVDDGTEVTIAANLPPSTNWLGMHAAVITAEAVAKTLLFYRMRCIAGDGWGF